MRGNNMPTKDDGFKSTELWLTAITGVVNTILVSTAPTHTTIVLVVCLTITAVTYLVCRTSFKIAKVKYAPDSLVEFSVKKDKLITE